MSQETEELDSEMNWRRSDQSHQKVDIGLGELDAEPEHGDSDAFEQIGVPGPQAIVFPPLRALRYSRRWMKAPREIPPEETGGGYALERESRSLSMEIPEGIDPEIRAVLLDPLDSEEIERLAFWAEHPELADPIIALLPEQKSNNRIEDAYLRTRRADREASGVGPSSCPIGGTLPMRIRG